MSPTNTAFPHGWKTGPRSTRRRSRPTRPATLWWSGPALLLSIAYELISHGYAVIVIDRGGIGAGMTARTAHLSSELDDYYFELIAARGAEEARLYHPVRWQRSTGSRRSAGTRRSRPISRGSTAICSRRTRMA